MTLTMEDIEDLRVWKFFEPYTSIYCEEIIKQRHIKTFPLTKGAWLKVRGIQIERYYKDDVGTKYLKVVQNYEYEDGLRKIKNILPKTIYYIDNKDELILTGFGKKEYNSDDLKDINRACYQARIDYLEDAAEKLRTLAETLPEPHRGNYIKVADSIDFIFEWYDKEITKYIARGTRAFEDAVRLDNDFDTPLEDIENMPDGEDKIFLLNRYKISQTMKILVRQPDEFFSEGLTVFQSIIYQITGLTE